MNYLEEAFLEAIRTQNIKKVEQCIQKGVNVNVSSDDYYDTALMHACSFANYEITKILLEAGADIDAKNYLGEGAVEIAKREEKIEVVKLLEDTKKIRALERKFLEASESGNMKIIKECLNAGVNINVVNEHGQTALILASDISIIQLLIQNGADLDVQDDG